MKRSVSTFAAIAIIASLAACTSTPKTSAEIQEEKVAKNTKDLMKAAPDWTLEPPQSTPTTIFAVGDGASASMSAAMSYATANAYAVICHQAGGVVSSQTTITRADTDTGGSGLNTIATRNLCPNVDISGAVVEKRQMSNIGGRFHAFVLVSMARGNGKAKSQSRDLLNDLDKQVEKQKANQ